MSSSSSSSNDDSEYVNMDDISSWSRIVPLRDMPLYALDLGEPRHVDYLLFAEFDIDKGSILKYQYPEETGVDEQELAELMLPDGAHNRENDWTTFFLNRDAETNAVNTAKEMEKAMQQDKDSGTKPKRREEIVEAFVYQCEDSSKGWELLSDERKFIFFHPTRLFIRNKDKTDFKVIERHDQLQYTVLGENFACVFDEEGVAIGLRFLTEEDSLRFEEYEKVFRDPEASEERWGHLVTKMHLIKAKPMLYCLNLVKTKLDSSVRRGARVKAMAVCTRSQYYHIFRPLLVLGLNKFFDRDDIGILEELYESINAMDLSGFPHYPLARRIAYRTTDTAPPDFIAHIRYTGAKLSVKVPQAMLPDEVGDGSIIELEKVFKEQIMTIYNALLQQKRILILGYSRAAQEVCTYTISCIYMVIPTLRGFLKRCYPYANLVMLDFLSTPGYIAGVTNSIFEEHKEWWDVLCDINTGKVVLAERVSKEVPVKDQQPVALNPLDAAFYKHLSACLESNNAADEKRVRSLFKDYTQQMVDVAFGDYTFVNAEERATLTEGLQERITKFTITDMYANYTLDRENRKITSKLKLETLGDNVQKLRTQDDLSLDQVRKFYQEFVSFVRTEDEIVEFLGFLPESQGGLYPVATGLFSSDPSVRDATVTLLKRIDTIRMGTAAINQMNFFLVLAYDRHVREMLLVEEATGEEQPIAEEAEMQEAQQEHTWASSDEAVQETETPRRKKRSESGINGARSLFKKDSSDDLVTEVHKRRMTIERSYR